MRGHVAFVLLLLAGCGEESAEERERRAAQDVAMVQKANDTLPPLEEVTPEPIDAADIERYDILGPSCAYAPGTSLGTRVIAREADAFAKIDGEIVRFAADAGSRELPQHSRSLYSGKNHSLRLQIADQSAEAPEGKADYEGTVTLRDAHGRVVYEGTGLARCGA